MAKRRKRSRGGGAKRTPNPKREPSPKITKRDRKSPVSIYTPPGPREKQRPLTPLDIEQGPGTKLKEIPNVSKKLSKAKVDENMQFLHQLLYGRKKAKNSLKKNILEFSGFVWGERDKNRKRKNVVEKLAKCLKSRLLFLCNVLDIPGVDNSKMNKSEIVDKLVEFLEYPHAPAENAEDDSERSISEERSSGPETDAENQENVQNEDEVEDGDDEEAEQSESAHESGEPKDEDEVEDGDNEEEEQSESAHESGEPEDEDEDEQEDGGDEGGGDQSESDHENDVPKDEDELKYGGDEEEGDQSESAHENDEPKDEDELEDGGDEEEEQKNDEPNDEEDSTEAESEPEENLPVKKGSTSSKEPARKGPKSAAKEKTKPAKRGRGKTNQNTSKKRRKK